MKFKLRKSLAATAAAGAMLTGSLLAATPAQALSSKQVQCVTPDSLHMLLLNVDYSVGSTAKWVNKVTIASYQRSFVTTAWFLNPWTKAMGTTLESDYGSDGVPDNKLVTNYNSLNNTVTWSVTTTRGWTSPSGLASFLNGGAPPSNGLVQEWDGVRDGFPVTVKANAFAVKGGVSSNLAGQNCALPTIAI